MSELQYDWPARAGLKPFAHQVETVYFLLANKRAFVLNDMGTGKTLSVLWATDILFKNEKIKKVLIICPLSTMRSVWQREIFLNFPTSTVGIAHGPKDVRRHVIGQQLQYTIINHDGVVSMFNDLSAQRYDIIVVDELTAYKSFTADRTKKMIKLATTPKAVWGLTGKPTPNSPVEAFSQAHVVNPYNRCLPRYLTQFQNMVMQRLSMYISVPRPEATEVVAAVLQPAVRYKITDCIDMPPMTTQTREISMSSAQEKAYKEMKEQLYIELENGEVSAANAAVKLNKLLQISAGAVKRDDGVPELIDCGPRLSALIDVFKETPQGKLIIFAAFRASIDLVHDHLNKNGISCKRIYGDVPPKERDDIVQAFQSGKLECIVIQPQSGAHGLNFTAASTTLWYSLIPSNEYYQQGNARMYRPGQTYPCSVIHFVSNAAEKHIASLLTNKEVNANAVLELIKSHEL